ncbi:MAG: hypothetical protein MK137_08840, partial [Rickettsiales bacterium]|nr:hypothetical protein [Rickettsiales bacterium]
NVTHGDYPLLADFLGDDAMNRLLWAFIEATPSNWFNISNYVYQLPEFMTKQKELLGEHADFACELALVEAKISHYFSIDDHSKHLNRDELQTLSPEDFMTMQIQLNSAATSLSLQYDVHEYIRSHQSKDASSNATTEIQPHQNYLLIYRKDEEVWRLKIDEGQYQMLCSLNEGNNVGEALESVLEQSDHSPDDIIQQMQHWFASWMEESLLAHRQ